MKSPPRPSPWEWLPVAALIALAVGYLYAPPGGLASRFCFFVGLGLVPGAVWRLAGRRSWTAHRLGFAAGLVAFVLDNPDLRPDADVWNAVAARWHLVAAGALVCFTQPLWGALRSHRLLADAGVGISLYEALKLILIGSFFNIFLPGSTGGDAYRIFAVTRGYKTRIGAAVASVTLDRLLGLPALILVVAAGMALDHRFFLASRFLGKLVPFIAAAGGVCLLLVAYLTWAGMSHRRAAARPDDAQTAAPGWLARIHRLVATNVTRPATLPLALFYGFMSHLACVFSCLLFAVALGVTGVPALRFLLIVPMAMTINAIPGAPGGVGQGELAMATLLDLASPGSAQQGVMIMLLFRLGNIAIGLAGGVFYGLGKAGGAPAPGRGAFGGGDAGGEG